MINCKEWLNKILRSQYATDKREWYLSGKDLEFPDKKGIELDEQIITDFFEGGLDNIYTDIPELWNELKKEVIKEIDNMFVSPKTLCEHLSIDTVSINFSVTEYLNYIKNKVIEHLKDDDYQKNKEYQDLLWEIDSIICSTLQTSEIGDVMIAIDERLKEYLREKEK